MPTYDYIIIGAGASGLLLADAMGNDGFFGDKSILLIDKNLKNQNDRTWCFWEKGEGQFEDILHQTWPYIHFVSQEISLNQTIAPYIYKMLRGIDFYTHYFERIASHQNITHLQDEILAIQENDGSATVQGKNNVYSGRQVFDSRFDYRELKKQSKFPVLQQHFLGWFVKTEQPVFDTKTATFMDFSIPQKRNTRFMYVLPFSETEALVEYTLFSETVLAKEEYETAIKTYLKNLNAGDYKILDTEQGNIPMTCFDFSKGNSDRILKIGIAGGWAKASTGFTFYNSTKKVDKLIEYLKASKPLSKFPRKNRFWFYDLLFLDVLYQHNHLGSRVFESLFKKRNSQLVLQFLDEDTSFWEDLKVMWACPKGPFIKALFRRIFT
ncbi:lycopene cyclase family protein [Allomuricauda sp. d1]|uniref:lycopene cyclase family protein n=1 Tax=Allomuricauda sp. d1 TaxID=3136725 RepID=UPI0031D84FA5